MVCIGGGGSSTPNFKLRCPQLRLQAAYDYVLRKTGNLEIQKKKRRKEEERRKSFKNIFSIKIFNWSSSLFPDSASVSLTNQNIKIEVFEGNGKDIF